MKVSSLPAYYYKASMPNLCQRDQRSAVLQKHGESYCGPTAIANTIIWLAKKHFQTLVPPSGNLSNHEATLKLIEHLGKIMKTDEDGTDVIETMEGLEKYIKDRGYNVKIEWKGIDDGGDFDTGKVPSPEWIMKGTLGTSNAILSVGLYNHKKEEKEYELVEGHYVAAAGFKSTICQLIIHDPYPKHKNPDFCNLETIPKGELITYDREEKDPAHDYMEISDIYICNEDRKKGANSTVIDGGFVFTVS